MTTVTQSIRIVATSAWRRGRLSVGTRAVPEETPVALTYDGTTHAVMMATPEDLEDFAIGFSLTEGIVGAPSEIETLDILDEEAGIDELLGRMLAGLRLRAARRNEAEAFAGDIGGGEADELAGRRFDRLLNERTDGEG